MALLELIVVTLQSALVHENILLISKYVLSDIEPANWCREAEVRSRDCLETNIHMYAPQPPARC